MRHHLTTLLDWNKEGFELCGEAHNGAMALASIGRSAPHVAIIDVNMPEMNGVELNRKIKETHPSVRTIMLSSYDDYDYVRECLKDGAVDYLLKHRLDETSLLAILNKAVENRPTDDRQRGNSAAGERADDQESYAYVRDSLADLARGEAGGGIESGVRGRSAWTVPRGDHLCGGGRADRVLQAVDGVLQRRADEPACAAGSRYYSAESRRRA
ncbi:response regulator [Cohnella ginsengisoli]|uniref:Response regulator n=1 Tax=Cohnella ginsengisoli TaxID=425004 RepID=A0A9X4KE58_9BACL|nr:response regulator [Cohnella ginsengisoli]MDG0790373.1 response regulator [Cohnella ginsengisoli]